MKKTLVLGASTHAYRYSFAAVKKLKAHGHEVVALGIREGEIDGIPIQHGKPELEGIDTVTMYLNPHRQDEYFDYLLTLKPNRIIFNPGSEHSFFMEKARKEGVEVVADCTLVMLSVGTF